MQHPRIIRRHGLRAMTNLSLATIYRLIKRGEFPRPIRLSDQAVGWDIQDVHAWIDARKALQLRRAAL